MLDRATVIKQMLRKHLKALKMDNNARQALIDNIYADLLSIEKEVAAGRIAKGVQAVVMTPTASRSVDNIEARDGGLVPKERRVE